MTGVVLNLKANTPKPGVTIRAWRDILRSAFAEAGKLWHSEMLPKHFGSNARRNYPGVYKERTLKWLLRKLKIAPTTIRLGMGPVKPLTGKPEEDKAYWAEYWRSAQRIIDSKGGPGYLVSTGTLQQLSRLATFRAFPSRFSVQIRGTAYTPVRQKPGNKQPHLVGELLATTAAEREILRRTIDRRIREGVKYYFEHGQVPAAQRTGIFS